MIGARAGRKLYLWQYFARYFDDFRRITTSLFRYEGISNQLAREIEKRLFYFGKVGLVHHDGKLTAVNVSTYQPDVYGRPEKFTFSFLNGATDPYQYKRDINGDGVLGVNTYDMVPTAPTVEQYALTCAHCDVSAVSYLVNTRIEEILKVTTENEAEKARSYFNSVYEGKMVELLDKLEDIEVDRNKRGAAGQARDILEIKDRAMKDFYNQFGVNRFEEKKERVVTDEVNANAGMLRLNLEDMYEQRLKMCEDIEAVFGLPVDVVPRVDIDGDMVFEAAAELQPEEEPVQEENGGDENVV